MVVVHRLVVERRVFHDVVDEGDPALRDAIGELKVVVDLEGARPRRAAPWRARPASRRRCRDRDTGPGRAGGPDGGRAGRPARRREWRPPRRSTGAEARRRPCALHPADSTSPAGGIGSGTWFLIGRNRQQVGVDRLQVVFGQLRRTMCHGIGGRMGRAVPRCSPDFSASTKALRSDSMSGRFPCPASGSRQTTHPTARSTRYRAVGRDRPMAADAA